MDAGWASAGGRGRRGRKDAGLISISRYAKLSPCPLPPVPPPPSLLTSRRYDKLNPVIKDVSFRVPGGRTIAFVGATGSGKSTLTRLLFRFYDVHSWAVRVDGQDVRDITQESLRRAIGMVPQVGRRAGGSGDQGGRCMGVAVRVDGQDMRDVTQESLRRAIGMVPQVIGGGEGRWEGPCAWMGRMCGM